MREHPGEFRPHVNVSTDEEWVAYLARMGRNGEWGDEVELRAAELLYETSVSVFYDTALKRQDRVVLGAKVMLYL
jgi:hypothetical protein